MSLIGSSRAVRNDVRVADGDYIDYLVHFRSLLPLFRRSVDGDVARERRDGVLVRVLAVAGLDHEPVGAVLRQLCRRLEDERSRGARDDDELHEALELLWGQRVATSHLRELCMSATTAASVGGMVGGYARDGLSPLGVRVPHRFLSFQDAGECHNCAK